MEDRRLIELAVDLVKSQVFVNKMSGEEMELSLLRVYNALHRMRRAEEESKTIPLAGGVSEGALLQADASQRVDPRRSIQEDRVTCLECGAEFRQITANHLRTHQLTPKEYKRKWGFPLKQPLAAKILTKLRSRSAKKRGLPVKLQQYLEDQREKKRVHASEGTEGTKAITGRSAKKTSAV